MDLCADVVVLKIGFGLKVSSLLSEGLVSDSTLFLLGLVLAKRTLDCFSRLFKTTTVGYQ